MLRHYFSRKFFLSLLSSGVVLCALGACAIHPLPENATGVKTSQIVHRNRCEAKAAVSTIEKWLRTNNKPDAAKALENIGIALSYTLDMTEAESLMAGTNFEELVTHGMFSANPSAGDSLMRENRRTFTVADNYKTLAQMRNCAAGGPNYQYPIVGTIGIAETIETFLTMALHEDLNGVIQDPGKLPNDPSEYTAASPTMVETLTFTTKITAGVEPQIMLTPVLRSSQLKLNTASLTFAWSRNDVHEVIIGLGMPTVLAPERGGKGLVAYSLSSTHGSAARARTPLLIDAAVPAGSGPSTGTGLALEAANSQIIRFEALRRSVVITP